MMPHGEILKAFRTRWLTNGSLTTVVPGGLHYGNVPDGEAQPYGRISISHEAPTYTSSTAFVQRFRVGLSVWSSAGPTDAGDIERRVLATFPRSAAPSMHVRRGQVLNLERIDGDLEQELEAKNAADVLVTTLAWTVTVQGEE